MHIGQMNTLTVTKQVPFGLYLDGGTYGEILLPKKWVPEGINVHDSLEVFVYFDSEDKVIATTMKPRATLNTFAFLNVVDVNHVGAFLDWGLEKDLLVPRPEQRRPMEQGRSYLVYIKQDHEGRLLGSSKIDYYLDKSSPTFKPGDQVELIIAETSEIGTKVIINHTHWGLIYSQDIFKTLTYGKKTEGYIKAMRDDGKIDVVLRNLGGNNVHELAERIIKKLNQNQGFLPLTDKSSPDAIKHAFGESKKSFKSALGYLYKQKKITFEQDGIKLT
jgi:uncharacterized protein